MNIKSELPSAELDHVVGGGLIDFAVGWAVGKGLDALAHATDHTPTNILNAALLACGRKPV